jgi:hypothetical protein
MSSAVSVRVHVSDFNHIRGRVHTLLPAASMKWLGVPEAGASGLRRNCRWLLELFKLHTLLTDAELTSLLATA